MHIYLCDRKSLKETNRIIPVSFTNITAPSEPQPHRLPMRLLESFWGTSEYRDLRFYVEDNEGETLYLFFEINVEPDILSLYVNGVEPTYLGKREMPQYTENHVLVYSVSPVSGNERALEIRALDRDGSVDSFIDYAEMRNYLSVDLK